MKPFFTIITRHMAGRDASYEKACQSLWDQTFPDWEHIVLHDKERKGIVAANAMFADPSLKVNGLYAVLYDDDDEFVSDESLARLYHNMMYSANRIRDNAFPELAFTRCKYAHHGGVILPSDEDWSYRPKTPGSIGGQCVVASAEVWEKCRWTWASTSNPEDWGGSSDFNYALECWNVARSVCWSKDLFIQQQRTGLGRTDKELGIS